MVIICPVHKNQHAFPPIGAPKLTIHPPAVLARQERHHPRHVLRHRAPPERAVVRHGALDGLGAPLPRRAGDVLPRHLGEHVALDAAGGDGVDRDAALAEVLGEGLCDAVDGALGPAVQGVVADADEPRRDGGHEDQPAAGAAVFVRVLADEELGAQVEPEDEVEAGLGDFVEGVEGLHARVRADDVDAAEVGDGGVEEAGDVGDVGDVGLEGDGGAAEGVDLGADGGGAGEVFDVVDDDGGAAGAEFEGDAGADAAGGAGDEGDFAGEGGEGAGGGGMAVGGFGGGGGGGVAVCGFGLGGAVEGGGGGWCGGGGCGLRGGGGGGGGGSVGHGCCR